VFQDPSGSLDSRRTAFDAIAEHLSAIPALRRSADAVSQK
jgi:ABC-type dipeptide/oligopeptide/nickel transport system ATPase subunit